MSGSNQAFQIQVVPHRQFLDVFRAGQYVIHGAGPTAARIADSPILEIPARGSCPCERRAGMSRVIQAVGISPVPTMNEDDNWMRAGAAGQSKIAELLQIFAVRDPRV